MARGTGLARLALALARRGTSDGSVGGRLRFVGRPGMWRGVAAISLSLTTGCNAAGTGGAESSATAVAIQADSDRAREVLEREVARIDRIAAAVDSIFQPLPLMSPATEDALRRFGNAQHLARARALGPGRNLPPDSLRALEADARLIRFEDSEYWIVRDLDYSQAVVVPEVVEVLREIGVRFQRRLDELGAPPLRFEISSVTRTATDQDRLRQVNPNAAAGESAHEYGTTADILYSAYAAPLEPIASIDASGAEWLEPFLVRFAAIAAERVAARRALEIRALLGQVLLELQNEGRVLVTLERQQPVFHFTVAR